MVEVLYVPPTKLSDTHSPNVKGAFDWMTKGEHYLRFLKLAETVLQGFTLLGGGPQWDSLKRWIDDVRVFTTAAIRLTKGLHFHSNPYLEEDDDTLEAMFKEASPYFFGAFAFFTAYGRAAQKGIVPHVAGLSAIGKYGGCWTGAFIASAAAGYFSLRHNQRATRLERGLEDLQNRFNREQDEARKIELEDRIAIQKKAIDSSRKECKNQLIGSIKYGTEWLAGTFWNELIVPDIVRGMGLGEQGKLWLEWYGKFGPRCVGAYQSYNKLWS